MRPDLVLLAMLAATPALAEAPYAGMEARAIKALSGEQVADLRAGRGMGLALPAELNGWPGPMHVLELAGPLGLTSAQRAMVEAQFTAMRTAAISAGEEVIAAEAALDALFASGTPTPAIVAAASERAGRAQGALRAVHLRFHLETAAVLTPAQREAYAQLRGYRGATPGAPAHQHRHRHGG